MLTLFHPASGQVRTKGVTSTTNLVLHAWLKQELSAILADLPTPTTILAADPQRALWEQWRRGLSVKPTLCADLPPLRILLIMDNLTGHKSAAWLIWCFQHGILPLFTPLGGSWLNMAESIQRILKQRALNGHHPRDVPTIIAWLEATTRGWNAQPTPFVWGGHRRLRRHRSQARRLFALAGSGACTHHPVKRSA